MRSMPLWMKVIMPAVVVGVLMGGLFFFRAEEARQKAVIEDRLAAIGQLKADQIAAWARERVGDAGVLMGRPDVISNTARWLSDPDDSSALAKLRTSFSSLMEQYGYEDVLLVAPAGDVRFSMVRDTGPIHDVATEAVKRSFARRRPVLTDIHMGDVHEVPHVSTVAPLFDQPGGGRPLAAVVLVSDATQTLFPVVQSWPMPSRTAETLLVRRDGDEVVFLNELRHQENTALTLRIPLSRSDLPAVAAVRGEHGVTRGRDYRGVDVLAVTLDVPELPWAMVAKMDAEEAFASWRMRAYVILGSLVGVLAVFVALSALVWQRQERDHFQNMYRAEASARHMQERFGITLKSIGDAVISTDADGRIELLNPEAERLTGWTSAEAEGRPLSEVFEITSEDTGESVENPVARVLSEGVVVGLANHTLLTSRDGTMRPIADSGAPIQDVDGRITGVVLVFRDMSDERERERHVAEIHRRQSHLLRVLTAIRDVNQLITREENVQRLIQGACDAMTHTLGRGSAHIVLVDEHGTLLTTAASGSRERADRLTASLTSGRLPECIRELLETPGVTTIPHRPGDFVGDLDAQGPGEEGAFGVRLEFGDRIYGVFVVSVPKEFMTDESERKLFGEMADDIAFALRKIERSDERRELRERYRLLAENTVDCIWLMGLDTRFTYVNPASEKLFGYPPEEMVGVPLRRFCTEDEYRRMETEIQKALAALPDFEFTVFETELLHRDGHTVPVEITGKVLLDDDGRPIALQGITRDISERREARRELLEQERMLNETGRMAKVGGWEHDLETGEALWTEALYDIMEIPPDTEPPGRDDFATYYPPEHLATLEEAYGLAVREGTPFDLELEVYTATGRRLWVRAYGEPVFENGTCVKVRGTFQDISDRKTAEADSERMRRLLNFAIEQSPVPVMIAAGPDVTITHMNQAAKDLLVKVPEDVGGVKLEEHRDYWPSFYPDGTPYRVEDLPLARAVRQGETTKDAEIVIRQGDTEEWVSASAAPLRSRTGKVVAGILVFPRITEHKRAVEALRTSERRWRSYVENAPYGVFVIDQEGRYIDVNPEACRMSGYTEDELLGMRILELASPAGRERGAQSYRLLAERGSWSGEIEIVRKDGETRRWSLAAVRLSENRFLGFTEDITERLRDEEERERLQVELTQAQKMESVGRLAGGVAHDFNNMLQVMLGGTELLLAKVGEESGLREDLQEIRAAAERSAELTRQLLAFARKQVSEPKLLNLNQAIDGMTKMLGRLIGEEIELAWRPDSEVWHVRIDPTQVNQVLANLVVNASDAIDGRGTIEIATENVAVAEPEETGGESPPAGEYVLLSVADDGKGMDRETLSLIFDPFFTSKEVGKGTGLGLSTVYGIVKQNDGHITVSSRPGEGTTFRIYLPRYEGEAQNGEAEPRVAERAGHGEAILVVEDEASILRLCESALGRLGYEVLATESPSEAVRLAEGACGRLALLITDVVMPEMDGRRLADRVTELCPDVSVIFMSGYTADAVARHGVLEEGVTLIRKPFRVSDLAAKVREVLGSDEA